MYYSNLSPSQDFVLYKNLLEDYLTDQKNEEVRKLFEEVLTATHNLVKGEIQENAVDHKIFNLVIALSDYNNEANRRYFSAINPREIGEAQLLTLKNILISLGTA